MGEAAQYLAVFIIESLHFTIRAVFHELADEFYFVELRLRGEGLRVGDLGLQLFPEGRDLGFKGESCVGEVQFLERGFLLAEILNDHVEVGEGHLLLDPVVLADFWEDVEGVSGHVAFFSFGWVLNGLLDLSEKVKRIGLGHYDETVDTFDHAVFLEDRAVFVQVVDQPHGDTGDIVAELDELINVHDQVGPLGQPQDIVDACPQLRPVQPVFGLQHLLAQVDNLFEPRLGRILDLDLPIHEFVDRHWIVVAWLDARVGVERVLAVVDERVVSVVQNLE